MTKQAIVLKFLALVSITFEGKLEKQEELKNIERSTESAQFLNWLWDYIRHIFAATQKEEASVKKMQVVFHTSSRLNSGVCAAAVFFSVFLVLLGVSFAVPTELYRLSLCW